ncbi:transmembrane protein 53 [Chrysoperla carnea]|uniref:transmembrane protein 53 n=1 Tax=Chrysoperla carnea TaxID=189513 RepID=UPI001D075022|nr:transmembrane protein 53 [Chrysoperla carnea]
MAFCSPSLTDGDLEFYMRLPNPNYNYNQQLTDSDYVFVVNETNLPVVLLLGWAGCQDKYLAKYSAIYEDKGLITIRYTAPINCLFWKRHEMKNLGEKLVKLLLELNFENHPIIVHLFSNGGAFLYQHLSMALKKTEKPVQITGVIFDSAPGERRVRTMFKAISAIIGGNIFYNISMSLIMTIFICTIWLFETVTIKFNSGKTLPSDPIGNLKDETFLWPQHFIYSKADELIPYTDIEKFAEERKKRGVDVTELCFEDSPHVKHFSWYKEEYTNSVISFLKKCLSLKSNFYKTADTKK